MEQIKDCFVTGTWDETEDAETLLKEDGNLILVIEKFIILMTTEQ